MLASTVDQLEIVDFFTPEWKNELLEFNEFVKGCHTLDNITRTDELAVKFHSNPKCRLHKPLTLFPTGVALLQKANEMSEFASKQADAFKDWHFCKNKTSLNDKIAILCLLICCLCVRCTYTFGRLFVCLFACVLMSLCHCLFVCLLVCLFFRSVVLSCVRPPYVLHRRLPKRTITSID